MEVAAAFGHCLEFAPLLSTAARSLDMRADPSRPQLVRNLLRNVTSEVMEVAIKRDGVGEFEMDRLIPYAPPPAALVAAKLLRGNPNADTLLSQHEHTLLSPMTPAHQLKNLWEACGKGDAAKVSRLLSRHSVCRDNPHALWVAVSTNNVACVQALLPHAQLRPYPKIWLHVVDRKKDQMVEALRPFLSPVSFSHDLFSLAALYDFRPYLTAALPLADTKSILAAFDVAVCESNEAIQDMLYTHLPDPAAVLTNLIRQGLSPSQVKHLAHKVECQRQKALLEEVVGECHSARSRKM